MPVTAEGRPRIEACDERHPPGVAALKLAESSVVDARTCGNKTLEVRLERFPWQRKPEWREDQGLVWENDGEGDERRLPAPACRSGQGMYVGAREMPGDRCLPRQVSGGAQRSTTAFAMSLWTRRWQHLRVRLHVAVRLCPVCASSASEGHGDSSPGPPGGIGKRKM